MAANHTDASAGMERHRPTARLPPKSPAAHPEPFIRDPGAPDSMQVLATPGPPDPPAFFPMQPDSLQAARKRQRPAGYGDPNARSDSPKSPRHCNPQPARRSPETQSQSLQTNVPQGLPSAAPPPSLPHQRHAHRSSALQSSSFPAPSVQLPLSHREKPRHATAAFGPQHALGPNRTAQDVIHSKQPPDSYNSSESADDDPDDYEDDAFFYDPAPLVLQPESRPISQQQLAAEVKGIYSGLVMVESKCIAIINAQSTTDGKAEPGRQLASYPQHMDHSQALIALHRTLLHEHHDFLLASQHPSASQAIKDLASRYSMPARMWKHGIHNFLELLRHRLPESLDYMLAFIYLAYQMMALLFDTVKAFEETWIECLGDLARYRMAIEDEDLRDREIWTGVARTWYLRAVDKNATIGRLYHHLAILARHNPVQQLSSYSRSLTAIQPFLSTRESVLTLFEPLLQRWKDPHARAMSIDSWFVIMHAVMFLRESSDQLDTARTKFFDMLNDSIAKLTFRWKEPGACIAISNIAAVLKYGCHDSKLRKILMPEERSGSQPEVLEPERDATSPDPDELPTPGGREPNEWHVLKKTFSICLTRTNDNNVLPMVHVMAVFLFSLAGTVEGAAFVVQYAPWREFAAYLNDVIANLHINRIHNGDSFPEPATVEDRVPLMEDFLMNGQVWSNGIFPPDWFARASSDLDERFMEHPGTLNHRANRLLWLCSRLAHRCPAADVLGNDGHWLTFDQARMRFSDVVPYARARHPRTYRTESRAVASPQSFSDISSPGPKEAKDDSRHAPRISRVGYGENSDEEDYMVSIES